MKKGPKKTFKNHGIPQSNQLIQILNLKKLIKIKRELKKKKNFAYKEDKNEDGGQTLL